jgi:hypothetical protein
MLQGVTSASQKCQKTGTPNFLQGVTEAPRTAPSALHPKGAASCPQQCHNGCAPTSYRGLLCLRRNAITSPPSKGAVLKAQQCHHRIAPDSFIWCQDMTAVMPAIARTKGRAICRAQQCYTSSALPNQFNGVIVKTQKCRDIVAPRGEPSNVRRDAYNRALSPTNYRSHHDHAEMPKSERSTGKGQRTNAAMPKQKRLSHQLQGAIQKSQRCCEIPAPTEFGP